MDKGLYGWVLAVIILLLVTGGMSMGHGYFNIGMGFGFALMFLFWIAVIWLVFELVRDKPARDSKDSLGSLGILKERYAKGEITKKQFDQMKKEIV